METKSLSEDLKTRAFLLLVALTVTIDVILLMWTLNPASKLADLPLVQKSTTEIRAVDNPALKPSPFGMTETAALLR